SSGFNKYEATICIFLSTITTSCISPNCSALWEASFSCPNSSLNCSTVYSLYLIRQSPLLDSFLSFVYSYLSFQLEIHVETMRFLISFLNQTQLISDYVYDTVFLLVFQKVPLPYPHQNLAHSQ